MSKTHLYFIPGLAANEKIFENITLPKEFFGLHFLPWILPISKTEPIENYAKRMAKNIKHDNVIIIGVSFGGVMAQEISKVIKTKKTIIISSIKSHNELPSRLKFIKVTKLYLLFPSWLINQFEKFEFLFFNRFLKKRFELYNIYLSVRDRNYLNWSIYSILHWKQDKAPQNIIHIHGTKDEIFPAKNIKKYTAIQNGTHIMILNKGKKISKLIEEYSKA